VTPFQAHIERLLGELTAHVEARYGERLVSLVVFGSVGRGTPRHDSDLDVLLVADGLPDGRMARVAEFAAVERGLAPHVAAGRRQGFFMECSPVFKTPAEVTSGSPLLLDMVDDARILIDLDGFFAGAMTGLRDRLSRLGARRVWRGNAWFWDLKPDYQPGDIFEL
jgi:predicted nucleotidyltransferase